LIKADTPAKEHVLPLGTLEEFEAKAIAS